jgi:beta-glucanase (GH16 family)
MVLDSEFNGPSLDTSIWRPGWFGSGVTPPVNSSEIDCYSSNNVTFPGDGSVHLNATNQPSTCNGVTKPYTGALLSTNPSDGRTSGGFSFTYGVVEARVYLPADGTQIADWPGVFTTGQTWPNDGEDDIMEGLGGSACWHFHSLSGGPGNCATNAITPGWHTFASDWEPGKVTYYYDGVDVGSIATGITGSPMYIALDNAVSAESNTVNSAAMQVSYVRVWQH